MNDFAAGCRRRPKRISFGSFLGSWLLLFERAGWLEGGATHLPGKRWKVRYCLQLSPVRCAQLEVRRRRWRGDSSRTTNKQLDVWRAAFIPFNWHTSWQLQKHPLYGGDPGTSSQGDDWPCRTLLEAWSCMDTCITPATCVPYASYHLLAMILLLAWFW